MHNLIQGRWPVVLVLSLALAACATVRTTEPGTVGVEREQTMLVSAAEVNQAAEKAYADALQQAAAENRLNRDAAQLARVQAIGMRLVAASAAFRRDAPGWHWAGNVITSDEVNAWCMPGGKVAVYTGLLDKLQPSDDELAAVLGHEIAHALREHGREKAGRAAGVGLAAAIGGAIVGAYYGIDAGLSQDAFGALGDLAFMRPNSREMETEADHIGVELAARAGYDPAAAVTLWEKMQRVAGGSPPQWLSTHPAHATRIADLKVYAERVRPLYLANRRGR